MKYSLTELKNILLLIETEIEISEGDVEENKEWLISLNDLKTKTEVMIADEGD